MIQRGSDISSQDYIGFHMGEVQTRDFHDDWFFHLIPVSTNAVLYENKTIKIHDDSGLD